MRRAVVAVIVTATALAVLPSEAQGADTDTSFTLSAAGGLSVSAPASKDLGSAATNAGTLSAQLGAVTVTDERGALNGSWTVTVSGTDFATGAASEEETIGKASVSYWSGLATSTTGVMVAVPGQPLVVNAVTLASPRTAFSATAVVGNGELTFNPTVVVNIPAAAVVGDYSGTITHSVA